VVGRPEALLAESRRRLAEDQPDAGPQRGPAAGFPERLSRLGGEIPEGARGHDPDHRRRGPFDETAQVGAEARFERAARGTLEALDEGADRPVALLEREPRVALAPRVRDRRPDRAAGDPEARHAAGPGAEPARGQDRVQERQPERGLDRGSPQIALDAVEDRRQADELAVGVEIEDRPNQRVAAIGNGKALAQPASDRCRSDVSPRPPLVGVVGSGGPLLRAALLIAADRAAVLLLRERRAGRRVGVGSFAGRPAELVDGDIPATGRAFRREQLADRELQARFAARRGRERRERGIEVAQVGRPEDELRQEARERADLEAKAPPLAIDRSASHPAASAVEVGDDVARR